MNKNRGSISQKESIKLVCKLLGVDMDTHKSEDPLWEIKDSFLDDVCNHVVETITGGIDRIMNSQLLSREEKIGMVAGLMAGVVNRSQFVIDNLEDIFEDVP